MRTWTNLSHSESSLILPLATECLSLFQGVGVEGGRVAVIHVIHSFFRSGGGDSLSHSHGGGSLCAMHLPMVFLLTAGYLTFSFS